jgi:hypothetical protein
MENSIIMTNKNTQRYEIISELLNNKIDNTQASLKLKLSVRQTQRVKANVKKYGVKGVIHGNRGKVSNRKIDQFKKDKVAKIIEEKYLDFSSKFTHEKLVENHDITWKYSTTRRLRIEKGFSVIKKRKERKKHFTRRERKESYGQMLQFDGSYHDWFEGRCRDKGLEKTQCLLLSVDDATSEVVATIGKNESTMAVFKFWKNYVKTHGKPVSIYLDKFGTYKVNHKNAEHDAEFVTQFQKALRDELGVDVIFAHSPQAKGRVERMNKTFQDRLVKEMRLANINTIAEANEFLKSKFVPEFKKKFCVEAKKSGDLHSKLTSQEKENLNNIFSRKTERTVRNDYVVQFKNKYYQLLEVQKKATVFRNDSVIVEEHLDDSIQICKNGKHLNFEELKEKPKKEINVKLVAITKNKSSYIPPIEHPWRRHNRSKK